MDIENKEWSGGGAAEHGCRAPRRCRFGRPISARGPRASATSISACGHGPVPQRGGGPQGTGPGCQPILPPSAASSVAPGPLERHEDGGGWRSGQPPARRSSGPQRPQRGPQSPAHGWALGRNHSAGLSVAHASPWPALRSSAALDAPQKCNGGKQQRTATLRAGTSRFREAATRQLLSVTAPTAVGYGPTAE